MILPNDSPVPTVTRQTEEKKDSIALSEWLGDRCSF